MRVPESLSPSVTEPTLVRQVIAIIEEKMRKGSLRPGNRLPSERELGNILSVSRTVVRGAVSDLTARGLLQALPGGGYEVQTPALSSITESLGFVLRGGEKGLTYAHIHQVRRVLEVEIAGLAALFHTTADLAAMEHFLTIMAQEAAPTEAYCDADVCFHRALAVATQNPLFVLLLDAIADVLMEVRRSGTRLRGSVESGQRHHTAIFEEVRNQNEIGARAAMVAHLVESEEIQRRVTEGNLPGKP